MGMGGGGPGANRRGCGRITAAEVCILVKRTLEQETDSNDPGGIQETTNSPRLSEKQK